MKTLPVSAALTAAALLAAASAFAQAPVSTGTVASVAKEAGTMILNSTQTGKPVTFFGLEKAKVMDSTGTALTLTDVRAGALVSVHYQPQGDRWMVSRIVVPVEATRPNIPASTPVLTAKENAAAKTPAANDRDITTNPSNNARIDGDRTTQPSNAAKAATDGDRTTQPSTAAKALTDGDRTTQPSGKAPGDTDITKRDGNK